MTVDHDWERHTMVHRMDNVPTMTVLAHRSSHRDTVLDATCLLSGAQPETAPHLWACSALSHGWGPGVGGPECGDAGGPATPRPIGCRLSWSSGQQPCGPPLCSGPTSSAGVHRAPRAGHGVHAPRHRGVHTGLVHSRPGAYHVPEGLPRPRQHDGVGIAGATPAPASGAGGGTAGAPGVRMVARGVTTWSSRLPLSLCGSTHLHTARTQHTQPRPFTCTRG